MTKGALGAANFLCNNERQQWWSGIGVPFHSLGLISINSLESLSMLSEESATLENVATIFGSPTSREALKTAQVLVKDAEDKKKKGMEAIQGALTLQPDMSTARSWLVGVTDECVVVREAKTLDIALSTYEETLLKQAYLAGGGISLADLFHLLLGKLIQELGFPELFCKYPHVAGWLDELSKRKS